MRTVRRHLIAGSAAILMLVFTGVAVATVPSDLGPHTDPALRVYPVCPSRDQHVLSSTTTGANATLVPAGARRVLLCRYSGLAGFPQPVGSARFRLIAHHIVTTPATVRSLATDLNALKPAIGARACPSDNGTAIVAFFRYGSAPKADDPVTIDLSSCSSVTNGLLQRTAGTVSGLRLVRQLKLLTPFASSSRTGVLTGAIIFAGGPALAPGQRKQPVAGLVTVFGARGRLIARERVRAGHLFRFRLAPGRYQLPDPTRHQPRAGIVDCPAATAVVSAGHTTRVNVDYGCGVP